MITPSNPFADYASLRAAGPVHRISGSDGKPAWLVTRYDDVRQALADPRLSLDKSNGLPGNYRGMALPPALDANLLNMDPPDHTRIRRLVGQAFTGRRVEALRAPIRSTAEALLNEVIAAGTADLLAAYAAPLPIAVICDLLGVPEETRTDFRQWTDVLVAPDPSRPDAARQAIGAMLCDLSATHGNQPFGPRQRLCPATRQPRQPVGGSGTTRPIHRMPRRNHRDLQGTVRNQSRRTPPLWHRFAQPRRRTGRVRPARQCPRPIGRSS